MFKKSKKLLLLLLSLLLLVACSDNVLEPDLSDEPVVTGSGRPDDDSGNDIEPVEKTPPERCAIP